MFVKTFLVSLPFVVASMAFAADSDDANNSEIAQKTIESCSSLLPDGQYTLNINAKVSNTEDGFHGQIELSDGKDEGEKPEGLEAYIQCVHRVVKN